MPDSSFFDPMEMGAPGMFPMAGPQRQRQTPTFKAGYNNIYGTKANVGFDPVTKQATVDARFPLGDFRNQTFLTGGGYASPATPEQKADWGVRIGFEKKIAPQGLPIGQLIDQSLGQAVGIQNAGGFSLDSRARMIEAMSPEDRQRLFQDIKTGQNQYLDRQLGVVPGATKYGINFGVDMAPTPGGNGPGPTMSMGTQPGTYYSNQQEGSMRDYGTEDLNSIPNAAAKFAKAYAAGLQ